MPKNQQKLKNQYAGNQPLILEAKFEEDHFTLALFEVLK